MRPIVRIVRMLAGLGAWTMWVPPILLASWSVMYLWDVFEYATAPGVPVAFEYEGPRGMVRVRAKSYAIDVTSRRAIALELEVRSPANTRVIYVDRAIIEQDKLNVTNVQAHGVHAVLERMPNGEFTFHDVIPKAPETKGPESSVRVEAHNVKLSYLDRTRQLVTLGGRAGQVVANGRGSGWLVNGTFEFKGVGAVPTQLLIGPDNLFEVDLGLQNTEAAPLVPLINRYLAQDEQLPFNVQTARFDGKLQLVGAAGALMKAYGNLKVRASQYSAAGFQGNKLLSSFRLYGERASGSFDTQGGGLEINADRFAFDWSKGAKLYAEGSARLKSLAQLPKAWRQGIPASTAVSGGRFEGNAGIQGDRWQVNGKLASTTVVAEGERVSNVRVSIAASERSAVGKIESATWSGVPLRGAFDVSAKSGAVNAFIQSDSVNLGPLARRYNLPLTGSGDLRAVISSLKGRPQIWISSAGRARYRLDNGQPFSGDYEAQLSGNLTRLDVNQAVLSGKQGTLAATGKIEPNRKSLDIAVFGGQIQASAFAPESKGELYLSGRVKGTFAQPQFTSVVDVHDLIIGDSKVPWIQLRASGNPNLIKFEQVQAQYGFSSLVGNVTYQPRSGKLSGTFSSPAIQLAEFGQGNAAGVIRLLDGKVSGTLKSPNVSAKLEGGTISYSGATLAGLSASISASNDLIKILNGNVAVADGDKTGSLQFSGLYSPSGKSGEVEAAWSSLPLRPLAQFDERFAVQGETTGTAKFALNDKGPVSGSASGSLSEVALNGELVGSGPFEAKVEKGQWVASGSIGSLDQYASVDELKSDQKGNLTGRLTSYKMRAEALIRLTRVQWKETPEDIQRFVAGLTGEVDGTLAFSNINNEFRLQTDNLTVSDLNVEGRSVGTLTASVFREGPAWSIARAELANGEERISGKGRIFDDGNLSFEGEANKVSLSWLNAINPDLAVVPATADASFILSGKSDNPNLLASLKVEGVQRGDKEETSVPPSLNIDRIELKDKMITAGGAFQAQGFTGSVSFHGPLATLMPAPKEGRNPGESFALEANVAERQIDEFKDLLTFLDFERSSGKLGGKVLATGHVDDVKLSGGLSFGGEPGRLAFAGYRTELENPLLSLALNGDRLEFNATATGNQGGTLSASMSIPSKLPSGSFDEWLASTPIQGEIRLNNLKVNEGDATKANQITSSLSTISSDGNSPEPIRISGNLSSPLIAGKVQVAGGTGDLPTFAQAETAAAPPVDPRFDLEFATANPLSIRTISANLIANASGSMKGSLTRPQAEGTFFVDGGTLRLPNARIKLDDGGLVSFSMRTSTSGETTIEVPVTLTGRTSVSARGPNSGYQRYDIQIQVNGDLMQQGDLQLIGRSDPNDLTQEQILAIIGQRDLLEALATGTQGTSGGEFRDALIGLLLPTLSDRITSELATQLNLDYIALDYNPFEGAILSAAKSFNKYVTLEGRRALTEQRFVDAIRYELRLLYRVPTSNPLLSRSRFVLSSSNQSAWRVSIEFSTKF
ncbi:MAG: hypothetical protein JNK63_06550 [Chthonomonas sp.]|nr:hypothetical protein [Chthonomonas sp.]